MTASTLSGALHLRRTIRDSGRNHGAQLWACINVRYKAALTFAQLISFMLGIFRVFVLFSHGVVGPLSLFVIYGLGRVLISASIAWAAWQNMRAFRQLSNQQ